MSYKRKKFYFLIKPLKIKLYPVHDCYIFNLKTDNGFITADKKSRLEWRFFLRDKYGAENIDVIYME